MNHEICGHENLHAHTAIGSLLDGLATPEEYAQRIKQNNSQFMCISDHGMMSAVPAQIKVCDKYKITPNFAIELYVNSLQIQYNNEKELKDYQKTLSPEEQKKFRKSHHLLGIAYNETGYSNLVKLSSLAWTNGFYRRPRVNHELLNLYKEGITFTSCCCASEIANAFFAGGEEEGFAMLEKYMAMFGQHFYLEFMLLDFSKQKPYNQFIMKAHGKYGIPLIVSCDSHYANPEDSKYQRYLLMVETKRTIAQIEQKIQEAGEQDLFELQDTNLWLKSEDELNAKWEECYSSTIDYELFKQAKRNTVEIARKSGNVKFDRSIKFPKLDNANEILKEEVIKGFKRFNLPKTPVYASRVREELDLIFRKNFSSYFLILKTSLDEAKRYGREVLGITNVLGWARGSGAGCLVNYCLGITRVDPIKHDLLFSRFLSEARSDFPDIDCDLEERTQAYLKSEWAPKYFGKDYIANIGTYQTYGIRSALLDMAKISGKDRGEILTLTKQLDTKDDEGHILSWDKAMELYPSLKKYCDDNPDIATASKKLIHRNKSFGTHAAGIVLSSKPINEFIPLVKGKKGEVATAWTEGLHAQDLGPMGFIKYDWLVIKNLDQLNYTTELIKQRHGLDSLFAEVGQEDWSKDDFIYDKQALQLARDGDLIGVFQFDSAGIRKLVKAIKPNCFEDLVATVSLFRPGPMMSGFHEAYAKRKNKDEEYTVHPLLEPILGKTYGLMVYQEQVMQVLNIAGEIPLQDCYIAVKAISKKKGDLFEQYKDKFIKNAQKNLGWEEAKINELWNQIQLFSEYSFNKSHGVAYTLLSCALLWLKAHYPLEFYAALLHYEVEEDKIKEYKLDAHRHNIEIQPLDLNKSKIKFEIVDGQIYFGFSNIKGIGDAVAEKIVKFQPYSGFDDFLKRCGTDESVLKPLIGLRVFKDAKPEKLYTYYKWFRGVLNKRTTKKIRFDKVTCKRHLDKVNSAFGLSLTDHTAIPELLEVIKDNEVLLDLVDKYNKSIAHYYEYSPTIDDPIDGLDKFILLPEDERPKMDEELLELYRSLSECEKQFYGFVWHHPICNSPNYEGGRTFDVLRVKDVKVGRVEVVINEVSKVTSKKGTEYWLLKIEDANGEEVFCQVWEDDWERFKDDLKVGEMVKIEVKIPDGGFSRYTLNGPPKWRRQWEVPKSRDADFRVFVLGKPEILE